MSSEQPTPDSPELNQPASDSSGKDAVHPLTSTDTDSTAVATAPSAQDARAVSLPDLSAAAEPRGNHGIELLSDVELNVKIELGRATMLIEDVLRLGEGSVVELDKLAGDPVDVLVNDRLVARGEVLVMNDNFCVRISEIVSDGQEAEAA